MRDTTHTSATGIHRVRERRLSHVPPGHADVRVRDESFTPQPKFITISRTSSSPEFLSAMRHAGLSGRCIAGRRHRSTDITILGATFVLRRQPPKWVHGYTPDDRARWIRLVLRGSPIVIRSHRDGQPAPFAVANTTGRAVGPTTHSRIAMA